MHGFCFKYINVCSFSSGASFKYRFDSLGLLNIINMLSDVSTFLQQFHIQIWQITAITEYDKDQTSRLMLRKVAAYVMAMLTVAYWLAMLLDLLFGEVEEKIFLSGIFLFNMLSTVKYLLFRFQSDQLNESVKVLLNIEKLLSPTDTFEQTSLKSAINLMKLIALANIFTCVGGVSMRLLTSFTYPSENRVLIVNTMLPPWIDWQHNNWMFAMCMLWQLLVVANLILLTSTLDFYGPNLYIFLNCFLSILDQRIRKIGWNMNPVKLDEFRNELMKCLRFHNLCLRFLEYINYEINNTFEYFRLAQLLNDLLAIQYFIHFVINTISICIIIYMTLTVCDIKKLIFILL